MESVNFEEMRRSMVDSQLRTSGVTEAWVLAAMGSIPREDFVPRSHRSTAYMDRSIALDDGSVLNPAVSAALLLQAADVRAAGAAFYNALEAPALAKYPVLALYQEFLRERGALVALMSGSGSTTFALAETVAHGEALAQQFGERFGTAGWSAVVPV